MTPRFQLYSEAELAALGDPEWLIEHHLPQGSFAVLYGPPGAGKSFLALAWSMAIALGRPWLGHPVQPGAVVYVAAEGGFGLNQRLRAYRDAHSISEPADIVFVMEAVNLLGTGDVGLLLDAVRARGEAARERAAAAADPMFADDIRNAPAPTPKLFVFDTLARCLVGGEENSARDVGLAIANADRLRRETGASVLWAHHTDKAGQFERGSSALRGAADVMFFLRQDETALQLECTKAKESAPVKPRPMHLVANNGSCTIEPLDGSAPRELSRVSRKVLETLHAISIDGETARETLREAAEVPKASFYRCLKSLIEGGYIVKRGQRFALGAAGETAVSRSLMPVSLVS